MERTAQLVSKMAMAMGSNEQQVMPVLSAFLREVPTIFLQDPSFHPTLHLLIHSLLQQPKTGVPLLHDLLPKLPDSFVFGVLPGLASKLTKALKNTNTDALNTMIVKTLQVAICKASEGKVFPAAIQSRLLSLLHAVISADPPGIVELCHALLPLFNDATPLLRCLALKGWHDISLEQLQRHPVRDLIRLDFYADESDAICVERLNISISVWHWLGRDVELLDRILNACEELKERSYKSCVLVEEASRSQPLLREKDAVDTMLIDFYTHLDLEMLLARHSKLEWMSIIAAAHPQRRVLLRALELFDDLQIDERLDNSHVSAAALHLFECISKVRIEPNDELWPYLFTHLLAFSVDPLLKSYAFNVLDDVSLQPSALLLEQMGLMMRCPALYPRTPLALAALLDRFEGKEECLTAHMEQLVVLVCQGMEQFNSYPDMVEWMLTASISLLRISSRLPRCTLDVSSYCSRPEDAIDTVQEDWATRLIRLILGQLCHDERRIRLKVMTCLRDACELFAEPEEKQRYWHLLHLQWRSLMPRVTESMDDPAMQLACLSLMQSMIGVAGDFMQQRFTRDLWPHLKRCLQSSLDIKLASLCLIEAALKTFAFSRQLNEDLGKLMLAGWPPVLTSQVNAVKEAWMERDPDYAWWWLVVRAGQVRTFTHSDHPTINTMKFIYK